VDSSDVAGLENTKPLLIIPSGGLSGHAASEFFKASLDAYVRSGGVIIVFAQQNAGDLAALPVPEGSKTPVSGAGWTQDNNPFFRASSIQSSMLGGTGKASGHRNERYLSWPEKRIVLAADGYPTLIVYPWAGWVVVTPSLRTILSARTAGAGRKVLLRDLWHGQSAGRDPAGRRGPAVGCKPLIPAGSGEAPAARISSWARQDGRPRS
jgi:hypothetical protein